MKCRIVSSDGVDTITQNIHDLYEGKNFKCIEILRSSNIGDKITFTLKDVHRRIVRLDILYNCIRIFQSCIDIEYLKLKYNRKTGLRIQWIVSPHISFGYVLECIPIGLCYVTNMKTIVAQEEEERDFMMLCRNDTFESATIKWTSSDYNMIDDNLDNEIDK
jgi:hypothetical protein